MKKKVFFLLVIVIIVNLSFISASSNNTNSTISLNYPSQVNSGTEFFINLSLLNFPPDSYDVRLGVINNSLRLSRIWNGISWQSSYYYINSAINNSASNSNVFRLNITNCFNGKAELEIRIRDSKNVLYDFYNYTINISGNCNIPNNQIINNNTSTDTTNEEPEDEGEEIYLSLDWDSGDIINGKEFEIRIKAFNLEDKNYDVKVFIYDEDENKPISQVYSDGKWASSVSYINKLLHGPGDKSENIKLRIKSDQKSFEGEATIGVRIRESGSSTYKEEIQDTIEILAKEDNDEGTIDNNNEQSSNTEDSESIDNENVYNETNSEITSEVIHHLGKTETIKSKKNTIYKSKNELIKEYSMYSFILLILIFLILLVFYRIKWH